MTAPDAWREVYVWYEAPCSAADEVQTTFARLNSAMRSAAPARLLRRCPASVRNDVPHDTWMEIWPAIPTQALDDWLAQLANQAQACGLAALCAARHTEIFSPAP